MKIKEDELIDMIDRISERNGSVECVDVVLNEAKFPEVFSILISHYKRIEIANHYGYINKNIIGLPIDACVIISDKNVDKEDEYKIYRVYL